ncbi:carbamoyl-phosphate synthase large subunit [Methanomassiliicoccus luminyensis]|uniref:carbamoyl-phosphate synthase large subunit n=1 Tax=Methanomassiliicoccus luminyensis TaxID=1080712 RepID=UPI0003819C5D|nr:carbamoyl-phosphate synthase large subunit [Methanomassiliicoccus luminyensis]
MKRTDLKKIMVIGSGPIVIGQAAEFDFSGSQACRSLREEGYTTVLVNSNPATIQTDLETADVVYVEPLNAETVARIAEKEKVDGILSGMGGQTALNICSELAENGTLDRLGIKLLGTQPKAIALSEDRELFREMMLEIGEPIPKSMTVHSIEEAKAAAHELGRYPVLIRPAYTLGGTGGGIAHNDEELETIAGRGLAYSRIHQVLIEESVLGWKEFEYEVMRDSQDNCVIICNMENLDPMGIHTGESIVIAPTQTLSDEDHQRLRNATIKTIRALGIEGGCNIQFAFDPETKEYRVIEVNPRVSRSSALASKATGYPIARVAAKIACGYALDEIPNRITGKTFAAFEPSLDYIVMKVPRWPFDKFRTVDRTLGTQMKSTGEVMAIGRTVEEGLLKAIRSLEIDQEYLDPVDWPQEQMMKELTEATDQRLFVIAECMRRGMSIDELASITKWDVFFLHKLKNILDMEAALKQGKDLHPATLRKAKRMGFSDDAIAKLTGGTSDGVRAKRGKNSILPTYKMVDTCAAEFKAETPYFYSTYETENEARPSGRKKVVIVGAGPIRIGQGIEFDYACVHGVMALQEEGVDAIIINNNPETVSTDYDISDRLYFEPLTLEDVLSIIENEDADGVILQFGGQTAINLAMPLLKELEGKKTKVLGTSPMDVDAAEDRKLFSALMDKLGVLQPRSGTGHSFEEVREIASGIGYPVLVRPSYVIGGRAMEIVYSEEELKRYVATAVKVSKAHPILVDKYLSHAIEIDVDIVADGTDTFIGGILEHIEEAGVHSGDATMSLPPQTLPPEIMAKIVEISEKVAKGLNIRGLMNLQLAVKDNDVYMIEANPRASRTVPFVSKAIGVPLAKVATKVMLGKTLKELGHVGVAKYEHVAVKASVFPFLKLPGVDSILGPEMKSTGEVMGIAQELDAAVYKAYTAAGLKLPTKGGVYITVSDEDKPKILDTARQLREMGFKIYATKGTSTFLRENGLPTTTAYTISQKMDPDALGLMRKGDINLIINTPTESSGARRDGYMMRRLAVELEIPFLTTVQAARATVAAMKRARLGPLEVTSLGAYHSENEQARPR